MSTEENSNTVELQLLTEDGDLWGKTTITQAEYTMMENDAEARGITVEELFHIIINDYITKHSPKAE